MKAMLLLDDSTVLKVWQAAALREAISGSLEITRVAHCQNSGRPLDRRRWAYYGFASMSRLFMSQDRKVSIEPLIGQAPRHHFDSDWEGIWQRIPDAEYGMFQDIDVVIKFGMGLLRDPDDLPSRFGVLSYHHGDPRKYRGRPAGFYEIVDKEPVQGVIVQRLSNTLDAGVVLAQSFSRVHPYSYARTLDDAYRAGIPLLGKALKSIGSAAVIETPEFGPNYRLPNTKLVATSVGGLMLRKALRIGYGAFFEKKWKVASLSRDLDPIGDEVLLEKEVETLPTPRGFSFVADPVTTPTKGVLFCELMDTGSGQGEIGRWDGKGWQLLKGGVFSTGHVSYPQTVASDKNYLLPEVATHSAPVLIEMDENWASVVEQTVPAGLEDERLIDPTPFEHKGRWYLFASNPSTSAFRLDLWTSPNLGGPWELHPSSPVCTDVRGARMAGGIMQRDGKLFRCGQDGSQRYGGGVSVYEITNIDEGNYSETLVGRIAFADLHGPHTVSTANDGKTWVDYYTESFALLAGWRRLAPRLRELIRQEKPEKGSANADPI